MRFKLEIEMDNAAFERRPFDELRNVIDSAISKLATDGLPLYVAKRLLRYGTTLHRLAELSCSSEAADRDRVACPAAKSGKDADCVCDFGYQEEGKHSDVPRIDVQEYRTRKRVEAMLKPYGVVPVFQGDPRGAVVKLKVPSGATDDWSRVGICVP